MQRAIPVAAVLLVATAGAQTANDSGIRGYVVDHDDQPVTAGAVVVETVQPSSTINVPIDASGYFRAVTTRAGLHQLSIRVPGFATRRVDVIVPRSGSIGLPPIRLSTPTYYHARFVNRDGETIVSPRLRMQTIAEDLSAIGRGIDTQGLSKIEPDGSVTVGPLPLGVIAMLADAPELAQTRLPNLTVTGNESLLEGGTIVIQPGSSLLVEVVDVNGAPIPNHPVAIEDVRLPALASYPPVRTDQQGRATFHRLAEGTYRVSTAMTTRCNGSLPMPIVEPLRLGGNGIARARLVVGGTAALRVQSSPGPMANLRVAVTPGTGEHVDVAVMRLKTAGRPMFRTSCHGSTNADGVATFDHLPGGPYSVDVRLPNSTFLRNVEFRADGRETPIVIPDGLLSIRVTNAATGRPIAGARVIWSGSGYRVAATATGNGDVLLEGVGDGGGSVGTYAPGFVDTFQQVAPDSGSIEVQLPPLPNRTRQVRVITKNGEPIEHAIVELLPATVFDVGVIAATDAKGTVVFSNVAPRDTRAQVNAEGYRPSAISVPADSDAAITIALVPAQ